MIQKEYAYKKALKCIIHPVSIISIIILLVNDHFLKVLYPSFITGKLSDFAGLVFFPFLIVFFLSFLQIFINKIKTNHIFIFAFIFTGIIFILVKTVSYINSSTVYLLSHIFPYNFPITKDPFDLTALISLIPSILIYLNQKLMKNKNVNKKVSFIIILIASISCIATSYSVNLAYKIYTSDHMMIITVNYFHNGSLSIDPPEECYVSKDMGINWELKKSNEIDSNIKQFIFEDYKKINKNNLIKSKTIIHPKNESILYKVMIGEKIEVSFDKGKKWKTVWEYPEIRKKIYKRQHWSNFRGKNKGPYDIAFTPDNSGKLIATLGEEGILIKDEDNSWHQYSLGNIEATPYTVTNPLTFLNIIPMELNIFLSFLILVISSTCFIFQILNYNKIKNKTKQIIKKINLLFIFSTILFIISCIFFMYAFCYFILQEYPDLFKGLILDKDIMTILIIYYGPAFFHLELLISLLLSLILISNIIITRVIIKKVINLMEYKINKIPIIISFYSLLILIFPITVFYFWSTNIISGYIISLILSFILYLLIISITTIKSALQILKIIKN